MLTRTSYRDLWAIGVITYFLLCGYTPFDRDTNLEEMQAILVADFSYTPTEYWSSVSSAAKDFINRCLTIDPVERITAHQALSHEWITGEGGDASGGRKPGKDLLPNVKKNFNARRTLHAAIDTIRAINQLRAGGLAAMGQSKSSRSNNAADGSNSTDNTSGGSGGRETTPTNRPAAQPASQPEPMDGIESHRMPANEDVRQGLGQLMDVDPRGDARGQTASMIQEQQRRINEVTNGLWQSRR